MKFWSYLFTKKRNTDAEAQSETPTDDSPAKSSESLDLPEWFASSGHRAALKSYFGARLKCLSFSLNSDYPCQIGLIFLEGITDCKLVAEFAQRIRALKVEWPAETKDLIPLLDKRSAWFFPSFQITNQPKTAAAALQRGQIILTMENDFTLVIAPTPFLFFFHKPGSAWDHWLSAGLVLRVCAFALAVFLPALYIAIISYQYYAVPLKLFFLLAESRVKAPFTPFIEVLLLEALLEMFWEGAARISNSSGIAIGTLGGLLAAAGMAAVSLATPAAALFCGIAQLAAMVLPVRDLLFTIRRLRFVGIFMTASFGILGTVIVASLSVAHLVSLDLSEWPYLQIGKRLKRY